MDQGFFKVVLVRVAIQGKTPVRGFKNHEMVRGTAIMKYRLPDGQRFSTLIIDKMECQRSQLNKWKGVGESGQRCLLRE